MTAPPKTKIRRHRDLGALQDLLLRACPPDPKTGRVSITVLATQMKVSPACVYKWLSRGWIPGDRATQVVHLSGGRVSREEFLDFVMPR